MSGFSETVRSVKLPDGSSIHIDWDHESRSSDFADEVDPEDFESSGGYTVEVYRTGVPGKPKDHVESLRSLGPYPGDEGEARRDAERYAHTAAFNKLVAAESRKAGLNDRTDLGRWEKRGTITHAHRHRRGHHGMPCSAACRAGRIAHTHKGASRAHGGWNSRGD